MLGHRISYFLHQSGTRDSYLATRLDKPGERRQVQIIRTIIHERVNANDRVKKFGGERQGAGIRMNGKNVLFYPSILNALKTQQNNIWYYRFDWDKLPGPFNVIYGAAHAFDLPFAFGNFGPSLYANFSYTLSNQGGRLALSDAMMRSIGAFARTGDPNNFGLGVTWPVWPSTLVFDASLTAKSITVQ